MKLSISLITVFFVLLLSSCSKEKKLLKDIAGTYKIADITLIADVGTDTSFAADFTLTFNECDLNTNRTGSSCSLIVAGSENINLEYGVFGDDELADPNLTINPGASSATDQETLAYQVLQGVYAYQLNGAELIMTSTASENLPFHINGNTYLVKEVTAIRQ